MDFVANFYFGWFLYNLICFSLFLVMFKKISGKEYRILTSLYILACIILSLYGNSISPDYTSYKDIVKEVASTQDPFTHIETIYIVLIHSIGNNLWLFQLCIFIPQFIVLWIIFTYLIKLNNPLLFFSLFSIICLFSSIVGRYYLFISVFILGCVLISKKQRIIGLSALIISFFLHKAAILALPIALVSFFDFRITKRKICLIGVVYILFIVFCRHILHNSLDELYIGLGSLEGKDYIMRKEGANEGGSMWWQLIYLFQNIVKYALSISCIYLLRERRPSFMKIDNLMYNLVFWTVLISGFFYMIGLPDNTIAGRILGIGLIPACYLFSQNKKLLFRTIPKYCVRIIYLIYLILTNAYIVGVSHVNGV